ncbi:MAG: hypothetical protein ACOX3K_02485 [Bacilli bacterium]|jgi:hypothetical protein
MKPTPVTPQSRASKLRVEDTKKLQFEIMKLLVIIVPAGYGDVFQNFNREKGVVLQILDRGRGTATQDLIDLLGLADNKKDVILALVKDSVLPDILGFIHQRFLINQKEKGIAFTIPLRALIGLTNYKFLTNTPTSLGGKINE